MKRKSTSSVRPSGAKQDVAPSADGPLVPSNDGAGIRALGSGWMPVSAIQQFRALHKGPLYDPRTLPVIPAPFLVDEICASPDVSETTTQAASSDAALAYPAYRIADPLPIVEDDDDDEPYSAPLPTFAGFSLRDILDRYQPSDHLSPEPSALDALQSQASLADSLADDDKDNLITHAAVVAMVRLGRPKDVPEHSFHSKIEEVRDTLLRQRVLFPPGQHAGASSTKAGSKPKGTDDDETPSGGGKVCVNNPRAAVVVYDDALTKAALELAALGELPLVPAASPAASVEHSSPLDGNATTPTAEWSFHDVYVSTVQKVLKKTEALRKKQQLYVGYGRSVVFSKLEDNSMSRDRAAVDGGTCTLLSAYKVDISHKPSSTISQPSFSLVEEPSTSFTVSANDEPPSSPAADTTEEPAHDELLGSTSPDTFSEVMPASPSLVESAANLLRTSNVFDGQSVDTSSDHASDDRIVKKCVKSCGDPKSMKFLDKCEWNAGELTDSFDLVWDAAAKPTALLSTDPQSWVERARATARRGRFQTSRPLEVKELASFKSLMKVDPPSPSATTTRRISKVPSLSSASLSAPATTAPPHNLGATHASEDQAADRAVQQDPSMKDTTESHVLQSIETVEIPTAVPSSSFVDGQPSCDTAPAQPRSRRKSTKGKPPQPTVSGAPTGEPPSLSLEPSNAAVALASLFAPTDEGKLPHNLPPLTVVFEPFTVVSMLLGNDDESDPPCEITEAHMVHKGKRTLVSFHQPRPFYLRPPRTDEDGELPDDVDASDDEVEEFWDDALEEIQQDMNDELLVPMTPPSTPLSWVPPEPEAPFVLAPFTQMLIDRLEAGIATPKNSSDDESEEEEAQVESPTTSMASVGGHPSSNGAAAAVPKRRKSNAEEGDEVARPSDEAVRKMMEQNDEVVRSIAAAREERLEVLRAMGPRREDGFPLKSLGDGSGLDGTAWERTLERFLCVSRKNKAARGTPLLLTTRLPMRMEGTTAVVRRLMRRSKKDILALAKKSKEAQMVSFRPSRRFLAEIMRLRAFGSLVVALLSNPDDPLPDDTVPVSLERLGASLQAVWEETPADRQRRLLSSGCHALCGGGGAVDHTGQTWWADLTTALRKLHDHAKKDALLRAAHRHTPTGIPWDAVAGVLKGHPGDAPRNLHGRPTQRPATSTEMLARTDEDVLRRGAPFMSHFLPSTSLPSTTCVTHATKLAQLRRVPRAVNSRAALDACYMDAPSAAPRFARSAGGQSVSKKLYAAFHDGGASSQQRKLATSQHPRSVQQGGIAMEPLQSTQVYASHLYPLPVEVVSRDAQAVSPGKEAPSRLQQLVAIQRKGLRQLHELKFEELHGPTS